MTMPSPNVSNCGRPARPIICITSSGESSVQRPFSGLYTCVPLMMTVCAGRFTPQARVAVLTSTCTCCSRNRSSTRDRSDRGIPAWWIANPYGRRSFSSRSLTFSSASDCKISRLAESSRRKRLSVSLLRAMSRIVRAVLPVSLRECTNTRTWFCPACSITFSYVISFISWNRLKLLFSMMPIYVCSRGAGRYELSNTCRPLSGSTRSKVATSSYPGSVADSPTSRTISCVRSTCRIVRAMMASRTGPRSSCSRWISSKITRRTCWV
mmetsp:Transcript_574/g.1538  ORF Transcript_574/g.1538 Transcript_574/m.1538 type:complete len:267 (-) Transcript_574:621-1421(-)